MVKIENKDLQVSRELFMRCHDMYMKSGLDVKDAFYAAQTYFEEDKLRTTYSSFEGFKSSYYKKKK